MTQATRSNLMSVATTLAANIDATQDYIPVASTANFSTSVVAEVESTNEVVSFTDISENLSHYSEQFDNAYWSKSRCSISADAGVAPDGTTTADKLIPNSGLQSASSVYILRAVAGSSYTYSVYAKPDGFDYVTVNFQTSSSADTQGVRFNISTGAVDASQNATGTITDAGNGWYRCSMIPTTTTATTSHMIAASAGGSFGTYFNTPVTGDGSKGILIWGAQYETGTLTTYLPTTSAALVGLTGVTRGANGTTAASATSGDDIQQLPFAAQGLLSPVSTTLSENITAAQDYVPLASTNGFTDYLNATIDSSEVVSFDSITTNRLLYSQDFDNAWWSKGNSSISANAGIAPDGTTTAEKLIVNSGAQSYSICSVVNNVIVSTNNTLSCYAKPDGFDYLNLVQFTATGGSVQGVQFNVSTGVVAHSTNATGTITDAGNGWYRCSMVPTTSTVSPQASIQVNDGATPGTWYFTAVTGDGSKGILIWGAQLEATTITGYLPTTSASLSGLTTVTRGANGTTAASATSGDTVTQTPLSTGALSMPVRLQGLSVSSDGTGAGRLTLCDKVGTHLCDVDIPDTKIFDLTFDGGIIFPNGIYVANSDNLTAYTLYTSEYNSPNLTAGG
jgi:hypothetical protein